MVNEADGVRPPKRSDLKRKHDEIKELRERPMSNVRISSYLMRCAAPHSSYEYLVAPLTCCVPVGGDQPPSGCSEEIQPPRTGQARHR